MYRALSCARELRRSPQGSSPAGTCDGDLFRLTRLLFNGRDAQDAVYVKAHAAEHFVRLFHRPQTLNVKISHQDILERVVLLALIDLDSHRGLIGVRGCVAFRAGDRQRCVTVNDGVIAMWVGEAPALSQVGRAEG